MPGGLMGTGYTSNERPLQLDNVPCRGSGLQWINPAKFTLDNYQIGGDPTSPRGICSGPGIANTDFSVYKNFKLTERFTLKFSMDFFNFFNKPQFSSTGLNLSLSNSAAACVAGSGGPSTPWCAGHGANSVFWSPTATTWNTPGGTVNIPAGLQSNFGQIANDRGPREIQYGLQLSF